MGLYKRPDSNIWWARFRLNGHEIRKSTNTADRRAAAIEERRLRAYYESKNPRRRAGRGLTLAELGARDIERTKARGVTKDHLAMTEWLWVQLCTVLGADTEPREITHDVLVRYIAARRDKKARGQTISRELQALKRGMNDARRMGALPAMLEDWPTVRRDAADPKRKGKLHPPAILVEWMRALPEDARDEAYIALVTGLRSAELRRMTAQWIEPAPEGLGVPAVLRLPDAGTKTRTERVIALTVEALAVLRRRAGLVAIDAPLFHGEHKRAHRTAAKRIGYPQRITLRDLRHTFATLIAQSGGVDVAKTALGHTTLTTTTRYVTTELARIAAATLTLESKVGTAMRAQDTSDTVKGRGDRIRTCDLLVPNQLPDLLDHVSGCKRCQEHVAACGKMQLVSDESGTGKRAQPEAPLRPVRATTKHRKRGVS